MMSNFPPWESYLVQLGVTEVRRFLTKTGIVLLLVGVVYAAITTRRSEQNDLTTFIIPVWVALLIVLGLGLLVLGMTIRPV